MGYLVLSVIVFLCALTAAGQIGPEVCSPECLNGGYCHQNTCICSGGFRGEYCQIPPSAEVTTAEPVTIEVTTEEPPTTPMVPTPPPPSPPAPSIFPGTTPPNMTTTAPTPTKLPTPFTTTRIPITVIPTEEPKPTMIPTPPPPPPPSPSLFITPPVSSTPMPTTMRTTTRSVTHTMTPKATTKVQTTKKIDPILIETGGVTITLELPPQEFDSEEQTKFKSTIATNVNDFCGSNENNCDTSGVQVGPNDVVLYEIRGITEPELAAILELEGTDTVVSFYVTHPASSSMLVLNAEQLDTMLIENADQISEELGYNFQRGAGDATASPIISEPIEPWAIALCCVAGVVVLTIMAFGLYRNTQVDEDKEYSSDVEMQETPKMNGDGPKMTAVTSDISTQASQSDIIKETKHVFVNHYAKDPTSGAGDVNMATQVTYQDILKETGFDKDNSKNKDDVDNNNTAPNVTTASLESNGNAVTITAEVESPETNQIPPSYDDATAETVPPSGDDLPPPPPEMLRMTSDEADAVGELDNLVKEHKDTSNNAFENPAFNADTEIDEAGEPRTEL